MACCGRQSWRRPHQGLSVPRGTRHAATLRFQPLLRSPILSGRPSVKGLRSGAHSARKASSISLASVLDVVPKVVARGTTHTWHFLRHTHAVRNDLARIPLGCSVPADRVTSTAGTPKHAAAYDRNVFNT